MTSVDEKIFDVDEPIYFSHNRRKQDYLRISPTTGTANNLNGGCITFEINNHSNYLFYPDSFIYCKFNISNQAGDAVPGNITLEHNWFPRCFEEMRLEVGSQQLETISEPGEFDTMMKFFTHSQDAKDANIEGWFPDTGTGNSVADIPRLADNADAAAQLAALQAAVRRLNTHNLNDSYLKIKTAFNNANGVANRHGGWIKWPLRPLFGYLDRHKVTFNLPIKFSMKRRANDTDVFFGVEGTDARLEITKLEFWVLDIQPALEIETTITRRLATDKDIQLNLLKRSNFTTTIIETDKTWEIASITNKPRFLFVMFKPTNLNKNFQINNSLFPSHVVAGNGVGNAVQITSIQVLLGQSRYSLDAVNQSPQNFNVFEAYNQYEAVCKVFGIKPPLDPIDFQKLYCLYCFDLSAQDENLSKNGVKIQLKIKKSSAESLTGYCLVLEDSSHLIKVIQGKMTRID